MDRSLAVLGAGNMGLAITDGILASGCLAADKITLVRRSIHLLSEYESKGCIVSDDIESAANASDVLILAFKPQKMDEIYKSISNICDRKLVISIAAGVKIETIENNLPGAHIVRAMPNTPLTVMEGVTHICAGESVTADELAFAKSLFQCSGTVFECKEEEINALTALTSSSVAYFAAVENAMVEWAKNNGLSNYDEETICSLVSKTALGSSKLMLEKHISPKELIKAVASPNGTTEKALKVFDIMKLDDIFNHAMTACLKRAAELSSSK